MAAQNPFLHLVSFYNAARMPHRRGSTNEDNQAKINGSDRHRRGCARLRDDIGVRESDQQLLVNQSVTTVSNLVRNPEMTWLQQNVGHAKAVLISPEIVKAGFIVGGSGGRGVLVAKESVSGKWVGPAFYTLATASVGFQAGISSSETITLVMTDKGMNSLLASTFKLGADASIAVGPVGSGAKSDIMADLIAFSRSKGVYGGLNLDGTIVSNQRRVEQGLLRQAGSAARHPRAGHGQQQRCGSAPLGDHRGGHRAVSDSLVTSITKRAPLRGPFFLPTSEPHLWILQSRRA